MTALDEIGLIASREIRKNLRSLKGLILVGLSLLGAIIVTVVKIKADEFQQGKLAEDNNIGPEKIHELQEYALTQVYGDPQMGKHLANAPTVLYALLMVTIWLCPLVVLVLGFDGIPADLQHRSVRYWTVRTRRGSYFTGKVVGLWTVVALLTLMMHLLIAGVTLIQGGSGTAPAGSTLGWGVQFYLATLPISAAWCGLGTLISAQFRSPIYAMLVTAAGFASLFVLQAVGRLWQLKALLYVYPNWYDALLLSPRIERVGLGALVCFGISAAATALGTFLFARSDV
ncbi:MAG TPA: ABC transporter permease subunit [Polyangiaceae bacterium]|nr:ABC transporter permease subunit [Polyangiaceae bacterium]